MFQIKRNLAAHTRGGFGKDFRIKLKMQVQRLARAPMLRSLFIRRRFVSACDISIGDTASLSRKFTQEDVRCATRVQC